jgi:glutamine phosphoribosylpyrophosphate amidotransferase
MCGIFGSTDVKTFRELYTKNTERGNFVRSITMVFPGGMKDNIQVAIKHEQDFDKPIKENPFCIYYLGHVQSPTSKIRTFNTDTSHPFIYKNTYLAHNGVLQNFNELTEKYELKGKANKVDSSVILPLIYMSGIKNALSELKGTFGCWMYEPNMGRLQVFRSGSTLFTDDTSFSSAQIPDWKSATEGTIYEFNFSKNKFLEKQKFELNSPFFI